MGKKDTLSEKLWYPSRLNMFHAIAVVFALTTLAVAFFV